MAGLLAGLRCTLLAVDLPGLVEKRPVCQYMLLIYQTFMADLETIASY